MAKALDEQAQLGEVIERLALSYPTLSASTIAEVVGELHARFNGARIREYVPLFVERRAHTALTELNVSYD
ncbi:hypothetical protein ORI20_22925 [Mycobacterium sp. CVI_P3]|uniref:Mutator family transposase n=1 Tax=Mycobacterium pinniadriaticum TaxID=2994102 RepID=A0ABT3SJ79_9MYCO|nr:hypothetical protein [Mycobacterium pinniadriaticum]MCX2933128.1 hypothetical protein [Mycobacterium pinniadriaticum]MCX2939572.1 hypothetical protein [Mycobacterium pinniadriaticum]